MRARTAGRTPPAPVPAVVFDVLRRPGRPVEAGARADAERRLGHSFADVRVHTDAEAAGSARAVAADAYAVGRDVGFGPGGYRPATVQGRALLAHELVHTVQQNGAAPEGGLEVGPADDAAEREAEAPAAAPMRATTPVALRRQPAQELPEIRTRRLRAADGARLAAERVRQALARGLLWSFETVADGKVTVKGAWTESPS